MEIRVEEYGRIMFDFFGTAKKLGGMPLHWEMIESEARPLVQKLIDLNKKMGSQYTLIGIVKDGKEVLPARARIREAKIKLWGVKAETLNVGDEIILIGDDRSTEDETVEVADKSAKAVYVEIRGFGMAYIGAVKLDALVLKCPPDFEENDEYHDDQYWLAAADELVI